jgi:hypothetical protein
VGVVGWVAQDDEDGRRLLLLDALGVGLGKERELRPLGQLKGVHQADAFEGLVTAGQLVILVLDIHGGDVVGQQHDLVLSICVQYITVGPGLQLFFFEGGWKWGVCVV